jgi:UDP-N-acetylmuramyl pentapeptide phosphotransferase/UDP-N-acetylglucosamine-1-phosphate transferase
VTQGWPLLAVALADVTALVAAALLVRSPPRRLLRQNHAGRLVPAVLGLALVSSVVISTTATAAIAGATHELGRVVSWAIVATVVLAAVGLLDDLAENRARGFRGHFGSLLKRGRPTTGIVKLAAGVAAGTSLAVVMGGGPLRVAAAAVLMAVSANVWNALDVVPGRALKVGILALLPLLWASWGEPIGLLTGATLGGVVALLPFDLLERGMLGDAGSNPLGFIVGVGAAVVLPTPGVIAAAVGGLLLQLAAESVTISRLVEATAPLRWLDRLGRRA